MKQHEPMPPKCLQVLTHVAQIFEVPLETIISKSRKQEVVTARHTAITYFASLNHNNKKRFTQGFIGSWFKCDHTSVIHAIQNGKDWYDTYPDYKANYNRLKEACSHIFAYELTLAERIDRLPKHAREGIIAYITKLETNSPKTK